MACCCSQKNINVHSVACWCCNMQIILIFIFFLSLGSFLSLQNCSLVSRVYTPCTYHMVSLRDRSYLSYAELSTWLTAHTGSSATARPSEASTARSLTHHPHSAATCAHGRTRQSVLTPTRPRPGSCPMPQPVLDHQFARPCRR
jgi:hypothetical protein